MKKLLTLLSILAVAVSLSMPVFAQETSSQGSTTQGMTKKHSKKHRSKHTKKQAKKHKKGKKKEAPPQQ